MIKEQNKNSKNIMGKIYTIITLLAVLLISLALVNGVIQDREKYKNDAIKTVAGGWASKQILDMPTLKTGDKFYNLNNCYVNIDIKNEYKKIGIFKVPVFIADTTIKGDFINDGAAKNTNAVLGFSVSNPKGFISQPEFKVLNQKNFTKNIDDSYNFVIPKEQKNIPFEIKYKLRGADAISFGTGANFIDINIKSNWANPGFNGDFLPSEKTITKDGFSAHWSIPKIASASNNQYSKLEYGVSFLIPVDNYRMASRAVKYGALFLVLTFAAFFIFEIISKKVKVHPVQYILIGAALIIFYLLLLSLSEFMRFWAAYLISSVMTIAIIGIYSANINKKLGIIITMVLTALYAYLYTLLNLESLALLFGSLGLFATITLIMFATRNVSWYCQE